jgi:large subunit ribosomal protein L32e
MTVTPIEKRKIIKKRTHKFIRHQGDEFSRISRPTWRRPKGIDSRVRRQFRGTLPMVSIGYGSNKKTKHLLPSGFLKFRVSNVKELELLLMHNRRYAAEIAHDVAIQKRKLIVARALELNILVTNRNAKLRTEEQA